MVLLSGALASSLGPLICGVAYDLGLRLELAEPEMLAVPLPFLLLVLSFVAVHNMPARPQGDAKPSLEREAQGGLLEELFGVYFRVGAKSPAAASVCFVMFANYQMLLVGSTLVLHSMGSNASGMGAAAVIPTSCYGLACQLAGMLGSTSRRRLFILGVAPAFVALFLGLMCALCQAVIPDAAA